MAALAWGAETPIRSASHRFRLTTLPQVTAIRDESHPRAGARLPSAIRLSLADDVEGAPGDKPPELASAERVGAAELKVTAVGPGDATRNRSIWDERSQVQDRDAVVLAD